MIITTENTASYTIIDPQRRGELDAVEMFAGYGGMTEGVERADLDPACRQQYGEPAVATNETPADPLTWQCVIEVETAAGSLVAPDGSCVVGAGAYDSSLSFEFSPYAADFRTIYEDFGGPATLGCPVTVIHRWANGVLQELSIDGDLSGALIGSDATDVVVLEGQAWHAFNRIKGLSTGFVGFPKSQPVELNGFFDIPLSVGGALVGASHEGDFFWLASVAYTTWENLGGASSCLGLPVSDPYTRDASFVQDFIGGSMILDPLTGLQITGDDCPNT